MRVRKKSKQERFPLRKEIENDVVAFNKVLKPVVKTLPLYELLCCCHPLYRANYARKLEKAGYFDSKTTKEFTTDPTLFSTL